MSHRDNREADKIYPLKFYLALKSGGFDSIVYADNPLTVAERQAAMAMVMNNAQDKLLEDLYHERMEDSGMSDVALIGQKHNWFEDYRAAQSYAFSSAQNNGMLLLEADGNVHPQLDPIGLISAASGEGGIIVTEHELYGESTGMRDPTQRCDLLTRASPPLLEKERSQLIGLYVAHLIIADPNRPITVIIGENHLGDIRLAITYFLERASYHGIVNYQLIPSTASNTSENQTIPGSIIPFSRYLDRDVDDEEMGKLITTAALEFEMPEERLKQMVLARASKWHGKLTQLINIAAHEDWEHRQQLVHHHSIDMTGAVDYNLPAVGSISSPSNHRNVNFFSSTSPRSVSSFTPTNHSGSSTKNGTENLFDENVDLGKTFNI